MSILTSRGGTRCSWTGRCSSIACELDTSGTPSRKKQCRLPPATAAAMRPSSSSSTPTGSSTTTTGTMSRAAPLWLRLAALRLWRARPVKEPGRIFPLPPLGPMQKALPHRRSRPIRWAIPSIWRTPSISWRGSACSMSSSVTPHSSTPSSAPRARNGWSGCSGRMSAMPICLPRK